MKSKVYLLVGLVAVLLIVSLIFSFKSPTSSDTYKWKVYQNNDLNISLRYPDTYTILISGPKQQGITYSQANVIDYKIKIEKGDYAIVINAGNIGYGSRGVLGTANLDSQEVPLKGASLWRFKIPVANSEDPSVNFTGPYIFRLFTKDVSIQPQSVYARTYSDDFKIGSLNYNITYWVTKLNNASSYDTRTVKEMDKIVSTIEFGKLANGESMTRIFSPNGGEKYTFNHNYENPIIPVMFSLDRLGPFSVYLMDSTGTNVASWATDARDNSKLQMNYQFDVAHFINADKAPVLKSGQYKIRVCGESDINPLNANCDVSDDYFDIKII